MKIVLNLFAVIGLLTASSAYAGYGAIYYSATSGNYGYSNGRDTYQDAVNSAYSSCGVADCFLVNWEQNECNALATGPAGRWGGGNGYSNSSSAINMALSECGVGCTWNAWICD